MQRNPGATIASAFAAMSAAACKHRAGDKLARKAAEGRIGLRHSTGTPPGFKQDPKRCGMRVAYSYKRIRRQEITIRGKRQTKKNPSPF